MSLPFLRIFFLSSFFLSSFSSFSQSWEWAHAAGGPDQDQCSGVGVDPAGNCYIAGKFSNQATFGSFTLTAQGAPENLYVAKYDANGNSIWVKQITNDLLNAGASINDIAVDHNSNVFVTGYFFGTLHIDSDSLVSSGDNDVFLIKFDSTGTFQWARQGTGITYASSDKIGLSPNGNVYIAGSFSYDLYFGAVHLVNPNFIFSCIFVASYDTYGNVLWAEACVARFINVTALSADATENCFMSGTFYDSLFVQQTSIVAQGYGAVYLAAFDASGIVQWISQGGGGNSANQPRSLKVDQQGYIYLYGTYSPPYLRFGSIILPFANAFDFNGFLAKFDPTGFVLWAKTIYPSSGDLYAQSQDIANNKIFISGFVTDTLIYDGTPQNIYGPVLYILKLDTAGNVIEHFEAVHKNTFTFMQSDALAENLYFSGSFTDSTQFGNSTVVGAGGIDIFLSKLNTLPVGLEQPEKKSLPVLFPNPAVDKFTIQNLEVTSGTAEIEIYNVLGEKVLQSSITNPAGRSLGAGGEPITIELPFMPSGIYFATLSDGENKYHLSFAVSSK